MGAGVATLRHTTGECKPYLNSLRAGLERARPFGSELKPTGGDRRGDRSYRINYSCSVTVRKICGKSLNKWRARQGSNLQPLAPEADRHIPTNSDMYN